MSLKDEAVCIMCQKERACMQCLDCGPNAVDCRMCCFKEHDVDRHIYHTPEWWNGCRFIPVTVNRKAVLSDHSCPSTYEEKITIIALNHKYKIGYNL